MSTDILNNPAVRAHIAEVREALTTDENIFDQYITQISSYPSTDWSQVYQQTIDIAGEEMLSYIHRHLARLVKTISPEKRNTHVFGIAVVTTVAVSLTTSPPPGTTLPNGPALIVERWNTAATLARKATQPVPADSTTDNHDGDSDVAPVSNDNQQPSHRDRRRRRAGVRTLRAAYSTALVWAGVSELEEVDADALQLLAALILFDSYQNHSNRAHVRNVRGYIQQFFHELGRPTTFKPNRAPRNYTFIHDVSIAISRQMETASKDDNTLDGMTALEIIVHSTLWQPSKILKNYQDLLTITHCDDTPELVEGVGDGEPQPDDERARQILNDIDTLPGLDDVKSVLREQAAILTVNRERENRGGTPVPVNRHMVFTGQPGTGKTTIARKVGELYAALGVLRTGHLIETDRSGLIGEYLGSTTARVTQVLDSARGGVLFIDEAYALIEQGFSHGDPYGSEALNTLVKYMEDHRDDLVVILAGYPDEMAAFVQTNPGLASRIGRTVQFQEYTPDDLLAVLHYLARDVGMSITEAAATTTVDYLHTCDLENFGNARGMRNLLDAAVNAHATRICDIVTDVDYDTLFTLDTSDIVAGIGVLGLNEKPATIGFIQPPSTVRVAAIPASPAVLHSSSR